LIRENLLEIIDYNRALDFLKEGNKRFVEERPIKSTNIAEIRNLLAQKGQKPFAVVLSCSDSRVPPEIIFDVELGQIFVVRSAGNVADSIAIGSIEYAVDHLQSQLVVVLGHNKCGAVAAAISGKDLGPNIGAIISEIEPSVEKSNPDPADCLAKSEDENIKKTAAKLANSTILKQHLANGTLKIVNAKYCLESGKVDFFN